MIAGHHAVNVFFVRCFHLHVTLKLMSHFFHIVSMDMQEMLVPFLILTHEHSRAHQANDICCWKLHADPFN